MSKTFQLDPGTRIGLRRSLLCLAIFMMSGITAIGQLTTATITGTVTDQSGAAVPGATVTLKNTDTGISRTAQTAENGKYEALSLPAGSYEISAALTGFRTVVHTGISLTVGQNAVVDFALQVGQVSESVTVTGEIAQIETTTATVANIVDEKKVTDRSEEHTSELQSHSDLVCRLLLEKKKKKKIKTTRENMKTAKT